MDMITTGGLRMPRLGLGTWPLRDAGCTEAVLSALDLGYRHIDTAAMYGNEAAVGAALAQTTVPRPAIHVTTKVWRDDLAPDSVRRSLETSLGALRLAYVDLFLIHWPNAGIDLGATLAAMVRLREAGLARAIGVSNFSVALMRQAVDDIQAPVACNQIEYHVLLDQSKVLAYARSRGIAVTAYCPLARGALAEQPALRQIAEKHGASPEQVGLKWLLDQDGVAAIPKSGRRVSQQANLDALTLVLDDADRAVIAALPKDRRLVTPGWPMDWDR